MQLQSRPAVSIPSRGAHRRIRLARPAPRSLSWLLALIAVSVTGILIASPLSIAPEHGTTRPAVSAASSSWLEVPALARLAISRALGADDRAYWATGAGSAFVAANERQGMSARFGPAGVVVRDRTGSFDLGLSGVAGLASAAVEPRVHENRISFARGPVTEWYANGPLGLEQGFAVTRPVGARAGTLTLALTLGGSLRARMEANGRALALVGRNGRIAMRYSGLSASDSAGHALPVTMSLRGRSLLIGVRTAGARYPLSVDPVVQEAELSSSSSTSEGGMGSSVAIDGSTVVVGEAGAVVSGGAGNGAPQGVVYVFTEPIGGWANATQTAELVASDADQNDSDNVYGDALGSTVAISGETIVASAPRATAGGVGGVPFAGKLYVFLQPPGGWVNSTENAQLSASDASDPDYLGTALATDGQTVVAGEPEDSGEGLPGPGAVYVFSKPAGGWTSALQTAKLTASGGGSGDALGSAVAVSGATIVAGAPYATVESSNTPHEAQGALYVFTEPEVVGWRNATQNARLTSEGVAHEALGASVAMEGSTIIAGAPNDFDPGSALDGAYVFSKPQTGWVDTTHPLADLTPSDPLAYAQFGDSVGISGATIVVGSRFAEFGKTSEQGAAYVYSEPAGGWTSAASETAKISASEGGPQQAGSVGVSSSGIVLSAPYATAQGHPDQGAAYVFGSGEGSGVGKEETKEKPAEEKSPSTPTFAKPAENTTLTYTSTAPPVSRETFIGFPLNVPPGQPIACVGNVCTYAVTCRTPKATCIGSASLEEIAAVGSDSRAHTKQRGKQKAVVYGKTRFSIPAGRSGKLVIKLTAAGVRALKSKKKLKGRLTITITQAGGKTTRSSRAVAIELAHKR